MKKYLAGILFIVFFAQCKDKVGPEDCFMAAGGDAEKTVFPNGFNAIEVEDRLIVELKQDSTQAPFVRIKGGKNVIRNIAVNTDNGVLKIKDRNICNWTRDFSKRIRIEINCAALNGLLVKDDVSIVTNTTLQSDSLVVEQKGTGTIDLALNINGELEVNHRGFGEIKLSGYAAIFVPVLFDAGKLFARNLLGDYIFSYHYGVNELHIKPNKALFALVGNTGATYYYQEPFETPLKINRLGAGKVEKR